MCLTLNLVCRMSIALYTFGFLLLFTSKVESVTFEQPPSQIVEEGTKELVINCSYDDSSLPTMLWYQHKESSQSMSLIGFTVLQSKPTYEGQFEGKFSIGRADALKGSLIIHTVNPSDSAVYFCAATFRGNTEAYFGPGTKLTVLENEHNITPPKVTVLRPSAKECRDPKDNQRKKTLVCVATGFYPDHVTVSWKINDENVTSGVATDAAALPDGKFYKTTSRLRVSAEDWFKPDNKFTCIVNFFNGTQYQDYKNSVDGVKAEDGKVMTREKYLRISQNAKLSYGVFIVKSCIYGAFVAFLVWKLQGSAGKWSN